MKRGTKTGGSGMLVTRSINYDAIGNITYKSDAGNYTYPAVANSGTNPARPHAVLSVAATAANGSGAGGGGVGGVNSSYGYDANGNLISATGTIQNLGNTSAAAACKC